MSFFASFYFFLFTVSYCEKFSITLSGKKYVDNCTFSTIYWTTTPKSTADGDYYNESRYLETGDGFNTCLHGPWNGKTKSIKATFIHSFTQATFNISFRGWYMCSPEPNGDKFYWKINDIEYHMSRGRDSCDSLNSYNDTLGWIDDYNLCNVALNNGIKCYKDIHFEYASSEPGSFVIEIGSTVTAAEEIWAFSDFKIDIQNAILYTTSSPSLNPSLNPSYMSLYPSITPTTHPIKHTTKYPTTHPTHNPTYSPPSVHIHKSSNPTKYPSLQPSISTIITLHPTLQPSLNSITTLHPTKYQIIIPLNSSVNLSFNTTQLPIDDTTTLKEILSPIIIGIIIGISLSSFLLCTLLFYALSMYRSAHKKKKKKELEYQTMMKQASNLNNQPGQIPNDIKIVYIGEKDETVSHNNFHHITVPNDMFLNPPKKSSSMYLQSPQMKSLSPTISFGLHGEITPGNITLRGNNAILNITPRISEERTTPTASDGIYPKKE